MVRNLSYNTIVFESGFYDACMMKEFLANRSDPNKIFWAAFQTILYNTKEFSELKTFLIDGIKSNKIKLCGIDNQLGAISYNTLVKTVSDSLETVGYILDTTSILLINKYVWDKRGSENRYFESDADSVKIIKTFTDLFSYAQELNNDQDNFYFQALKNLYTILKLNINEYYHVPIYLSTSIRDKQMADNLLWIIRHKNAKDKIIVWTASMHSARNINLIEEVSDTVFYNHYIPMGQIIHDSIGSKMYSLAFSSSGGYYQTPYMMKDSVEIKSKKTNSIESYFKDCQIKYGIVNFQNTDTRYFWKELYSNPHGNSNVKAIWPMIHDGIFYIDTIHPPNIVTK